MSKLSVTVAVSATLLLGNQALAQEFDLIGVRINARGVPMAQPVACNANELRSVKISKGTTHHDKALGHLLGRWCGVDQKGKPVKLAIIDIVPPSGKYKYPTVEARSVGSNGELNNFFGFVFFDKTTKSYAIDFKSNVFWMVSDGVARTAGWAGLKSGRVKKRGFNATLVRK